MCGRYTTEIETDERELFRILERAEQNSRCAPQAMCKETALSREVFPSEAAAVLACADNGIPDAFLFRWGFPTNIFGKNQLLIHARAESVMQKPIFAPHWEQRRCIIPTAGFFEWAHRDGRADPARKYRFNLPQTGILYLAGVYRPSDRNNSEWEFVVLTREAGDSMMPIHHRMPVVLRREHLEEYLNDERSARVLLSETPPVMVKRLVS